MAFSPQALECTMLTIPQKTETAEEMQKGIRSAAGGGGGALPALCDSVTTMSPDVACKLELQGPLKIFQVIGRCACLYIFLLSYIYTHVCTHIEQYGRLSWAQLRGTSSADLGSPIKSQAGTAGRQAAPKRWSPWGTVGRAERPARLFFALQSGLGVQLGTMVWVEGLNQCRRRHHPIVATAIGDTTHHHQLFTIIGTCVLMVSPLQTFAAMALPSLPSSQSHVTREMPR